MNKPSLLSSLIGTLSFITLLGCTQTSLAAKMVDITVVNRSTGERLTPYRHHGKLYIAGTPGDPYQVEIKSNQRERVLTVLSVDGINVLTGQTAATLQSGYVIDNAQSYGISGWRKSMDDVAQFVFTSLPNSYAARTGRPGNVGVIGVAVYREKVVPQISRPILQSAQTQTFPTETLREKMADKSAGNLADEAVQPASPAPSSVAKSESDSSGNNTAAGALAERRAVPSSPRPEFEKAEKKASRLGTGHGEREYSPTRYTEFERNSDTPDEIITLYYDSRANLIARGIIPRPQRSDPQAFPASNGFVPDPRD